MGGVFPHLAQMFNVLLNIQPSLKKKKKKRSKLRTPFYKSKHMDIVLTNFLLRFSHADGGAFTLGSV